MKELHAAHPEAGITFTDGIELFEDPPAKVQRLTPERAQTLGYEGFRLIPRQELPEHVKLGYTYRTWCVNPMVYCSFLLRKFSFHGGKIVKAEVRNPAEVFAMEGYEHVAFVVNASGSGFGDDNVYITRGQYSRLGWHVNGLTNLQGKHALSRTRVMLPFRAIMQMEPRRSASRATSTGARSSAARKIRATGMPCHQKVREPTY